MALDLESGSSQYCTWIDPYSLDTGSPWSISFWVKLESDTGDRQRVFEFQDSGGASELSVNIDASLDMDMEVVINRTSPLVVRTVTGIVSTGVYSHVLITYDGSGTAANMHIYVDGTEVSYASQGDGSGTQPTADGDFIIGARQGTPDRYVDGLVADMALWGYEMQEGMGANLNAGYRPTEYNHLLKFYTPLVDDLVDDINNVTGTMTGGGPTYGTDPTYTTLTSGLDTDLKAVWKMTEGSGNRADSVGSNTLVDNATVTTADGHVGTLTALVPEAAQFTAATSEYLSLANNADVNAGDVDWTVACWVYLDSATGSQAIVTKNEAAGTREWDLWYRDSTTYMRGRIMDSAGTILASVSPEYYAIVTGGWYFIVFWHDSTADTINLQINNEHIGSASYSGTPGDNDEPLWFGRGEGLLYWDGRIGPAYLWKRVLSADDRDDLFNYSMGYDYPFTTTLLDEYATAIDTDALGQNAGNPLDMGYSNMIIWESGGTKYDVVSYWNIDSTPHAVIQKRTDGGSWTKYTYDGVINSPSIPQTSDDGHNSIRMGVDPNGFLHFTYDHHIDALNYRKSDAALSSWTGGLGSEISMLGTNETAVTYPTLFNDPSGTLYFIFRDGNANNSDIYFYEYDESGTSWSAATGTGNGGLLINGKGDTPTRGPYHCVPPCFDSDFGSGGFMHLAWMPRDNTETYAEALEYVRWDGTNWEQADGTSQTVPITAANAEEIETYVEATAKANWRPSIYSDSSGQPHIVFSRNDGSGYAQIFHTYYNGSSWSSPATVTANTTYTDAQLDQGAKAGFQLLIDRDDDTLYLFYNGFDEGMGLFYYYTNDYSNWFKDVTTRASVGRIASQRSVTNWEDNKRAAVAVFPFSVVNLGNDPARIIRLSDIAPAPPRMTTMGGYSVPVPTG